MATAALILPDNALGGAFKTTHVPMFVETMNARELPDVKPLSQYERDPIGFMVRVLGIPEYRIRWSMNEGYGEHQWDGTIDPFVVVAEALRDWMDVAIESGTGTGKSFFAAALLLWFIGTWYEARGFTFAPKEEQLRLFLWKEIGVMWPRFHAHFPTAVLTDLRIRMRGARDAAWGAQGYSVGRRAGEEVSVTAQGMHAVHQILMYEETPGIGTAVTEAGENTSTAPHNLRIAWGNPDHQLDALHLFGHDQMGLPLEGVVAVRVSANDHPNVVLKNPDIVPGAIAEKSIMKRRRKYGVNGRLYRSRVRGISPAEAADALIKLEWIRDAQKAWHDEHDKLVLTGGGRAKKSLGVDVADSEDGDEGSISRWTGAYCREVVSFACPDANLLGFDVSKEMKEDMIADEHVGVDGVGVGAGCVNELKRVRRFVRALGRKGEKREGEMVDLGGVEVDATERFNSDRSRWYWRLREDLRQRKIALPPNPELAQDLITPRWGTRNGEIWVESKEDLKKRLPGGRSPNQGDAVVYGNWVRDRSPMVSKVKKKALTLQQRLQREMERMDREEQRDRNRRMKGDSKYGSVLRQ